MIESDIVYEAAVIDRILESDEECLTFVSRPKPWMDGSIVTLDGDSYINDFIGADNFAFQNMDSYYKTVSMYKLSKITLTMYTFRFSLRMFRHGEIRHIMSRLSRWLHSRSREY